MSHRDLTGQAEEAIRSVFSDTSVNPEETAISLSDLANIIEELMNSL
jgi:hypothetical protein